MTGLLSRLFVKDYQNTSNPIVRRAYGTMVSVVGVILNLILFAGKFLVGTLVGSVAICADAINNLSDAGSQIISFISFRISAKPADRAHPFGHARIEYVASMIVSFLILLIGVELFRDSIEKIITPAPPERSWVSVGILIGSILVKFWMAFFNNKIGKKIDSSVMKATAADSLSDVLSTSAVLIATLLPLLFPKINLNLDAYMGVAVAILILIAGAKILNETKNAILGEAPSEELVKNMMQVISQYPGALGIHDMDVHNYGPGHILASLHVEVDGNANIFETHDMIDLIEQQLARECGVIATIHMDPIVTDNELISSLRLKVEAVVKEIDAGMSIHDFRFVAGTTHTNLIFDVAVPFENRTPGAELRQIIAQKVAEIDPCYKTVIQLDRI